jgi:hypothetical protein
MSVDPPARFWIQLSHCDKLSQPNSNEILAMESLVAADLALEQDAARGFSWLKASKFTVMFYARDVVVGQVATGGIRTRSIR